jgi:hypothetical protein
MIYQISEGILSQEFPDEAVLLSLSSAKYFRLNGVGLAIWELLRAGSDAQTIETALVEKYDAPAERVRADVASFLNKLLQLRLIETCSR